MSEPRSIATTRWDRVIVYVPSVFFSNARLNVPGDTAFVPNRFGDISNERSGILWCTDTPRTENWPSRVPVVCAGKCYWNTIFE